MKRNNLITIFLFLLLPVIVIAGFQTFGRSVQLNMAFHIGDSKDDDIITQNDNYISSQDGNVVLAIVSERAFGTRFSYSRDNLLEMRVPLSSNRFFLTFTKGNNATIASKLGTIDNILPRRFGDLSYSKPGSFPIFLRLEYSDIDLINGLRWIAGSRELLIKNENNRIRMELIR